MDRLAIAGLAIACLMVHAAVGGENAAPARKYAGFHMTQAERDALRRRVQAEQWANDHFQQTVLPEAQRGNGYQCALAYVATGDKQYADKAGAFLVGRANRYLGYSAEQLAKLTFYWGPPQAGEPNDIPFTYDLIADALAPGDDALVRRYMKKVVDDAIAWLEKTRMNPNMCAVANSAVTVWAFAAGDDHGIEWGLHDPGTAENWGGVFTLLNNHVFDGAMWMEPPTYSHNCVIPSAAQAAMVEWRGRGNDLMKYRTPNGASIRSVMQSQIDLAFPIETNGTNVVRLANYGHGGNLGPAANYDIYVVNTVSGYANSLLNIRRSDYAGDLLNIYAWTPDPELAYFLSLLPREQRRSFTVGEPKLPDKIEPPPAPSKLWPMSGLAMLRADESPAYWAGKALAVLARGGEPYGHQHPDQFGIILHARGFLMYPDLDQVNYEPRTISCTESSINHNTLTIDGQNSGENTPGTPWSKYDPLQIKGMHRTDLARGIHTTYRTSFEPERKFLAMRGEFQEGVWLERVLCLTREYLFDVFRAESPINHTYDWAMRGFGRASADLPDAFVPSMDLRYYGTRNCYRWIDNELSAIRDDDLAVDFISDALYGLPARIRMTILREAFTKAYLGRYPLSKGVMMTDETDPTQAGPVVILRRIEKNTDFIALHEPYGERPAIERFDKLFHDRHAIAVRVAAAGFEDTIIAALGENGEKKLVEFSTPKDRWERFSVEGEAYIRRTGGTIVARGGLRSFCLYAPDAPAQGALTVNGKLAEYSRGGGYVAFNCDLPATKNPVLMVESISYGSDVFAGAPMRLNVTIRNTGTAPAGGTLRCSIADAKPQQQAIAPVEPNSVCRTAVTLPVPASALGSTCLVKASVAGEAGAIHEYVARTSVRSPVELAIPIAPVNLDRETGGILAVKIRNRLSTPASYRIEVEPGKGAVSEKAESVDLKPGEEQVRRLSLRVKGNAPTLVPVKVRLFAGRVPVQEEVVQAACGVHVAPDAGEFYDALLVRAPGYTISIDSYSGVSRFVLDADGVARSKTCQFPVNRVRTSDANSSAALNGSMAVPLVAGPEAKPSDWWPFRCDYSPQPEEKRKELSLFDWMKRCTEVKPTTDPASGQPAIVAVSEKPEHKLWYIFYPHKIAMKMEGPYDRYNVDLGLLSVDRPERPLRATVNGGRSGRTALADLNAGEKNANARLNANVAPGQAVELSFEPANGQ